MNTHIRDLYWLTVNPGKHISRMLVLPSMAVIPVWGNTYHWENMFKGTHSLGEHISDPKVTRHMECWCNFLMS